MALGTIKRKTDDMLKDVKMKDLVGEFVIEIDVLTLHRRQSLADALLERFMRTFNAILS